MKFALGNLKLFKKFLLAPLLVIAFLLILGSVTFTGLARQKAALEDIFGNRFKSYQSTAQIIRDISQVHANLYKTISWANAKYDEKKIDQLGKEQMAVLGQTASHLGKWVQNKNLTPPEKNLFQTISAGLAEYKESAFAAIDLAGSDLNMATMYMETSDNKFQVLRAKLNDLLEMENKLSQERYDGALASFASVLEFFIIILVIGVAASLAVSALLAKRITQPVHKSIQVIKKIAEGDLTQNLEIQSSDEIGELARAVNVMRTKMEETVGQSVSMSHRLSEAASQQAASLEETSSSLEEMASMTKQNAEHATQANTLMTKAQEVIEQADASMNVLKTSMRQISQASEQTQKIVKTIDEISFQTNLLALNAAVEAARAGGAGAGFAVVAEEVRNLALRAAEAAKSTSDLTSDIVGKVKNGEKLVTGAYEAFQKVLADSTQVVKLMAEIAAGSGEQSQGIDQVNKAVAEMNQVTQQNAAAAQELASIMAWFKTVQEGYSKSLHPGRSQLPLKA